MDIISMESIRDGMENWHWTHCTTNYNNNNNNNYDKIMIPQICTVQSVTKVHVVTTNSHKNGCPRSVAQRPASCVLAEIADAPHAQWQIQRGQDPPTSLAVGKICGAIAPIIPMELAPMPGRITVQKQTHRRAGQCTKIHISRPKFFSKFWVGKGNTTPHIPPHILGT